MPNERIYRAWTTFRDGRPAYATDKPGCYGRKKSSVTPNCDWGYGELKNALPMSEFECKQFCRYQQDVGRKASYSRIESEA